MSSSEASRRNLAKKLWCVVPKSEPRFRCAILISYVPFPDLNEELGACAAPCLGDCAGTTASPTEHNASSFGCLELRAVLQGQRPSAESCRPAPTWPEHTLRENNQAGA
jgi:hypothetical protein